MPTHKQPNNNGQQNPPLPNEILVHVHREQDDARRARLNEIREHLTVAREHIAAANAIARLLKSQN